MTNTHSSPLAIKTISIFLGFILLTVSVSCHKTSIKKGYYGSFYANDCGVSHGSFVWAGEYTTSLIIDGNKGNLYISFSKGLGDHMTSHKFSVSDFVEVMGRMSFKMEGRAVFLILMDEDRIWNGEYNGYFVANKSSSLTEQIGQLPIDTFEGLKSHYYVELRLRPVSDQTSLLGLFE